MAFGARNDGGWRLCIRKGRTIRGTAATGSWEDFTFKSQKAAKACADELNEKYWVEYEKVYVRKKEFPPCGWEMLDVIRRHL